MIVKSRTYPIRLPETAIKQLKAIAEERYIPPTVLARSWLMERLEAEMDDKTAKSCKTCKYRDGPSFDVPCVNCEDFKNYILADECGV